VQCAEIIGLWHCRQLYHSGLADAPVPERHALPHFASSRRNILQNSNFSLFIKISQKICLQKPA
jgi:hypothetical protein